jgi:hypothetical protein
VARTGSGRRLPSCWPTCRNAAWDLKTEIYEGDALFLEWAATAATTKVEDGIDTFVFGDGLIRLQTVRYTLQHTS